MYDIKNETRDSILVTTRVKIKATPEIWYVMYDIMTEVSNTVLLPICAQVYQDLDDV